MKLRMAARLLVLSLAATAACGKRSGGVDALQESAKGHVKKGEYDLAIADLDRIIAVDSTRASTYFDRGFVRQLQKQYDLAIRDYDRAIALEPKHVSAMNSRGFAYQMKNDYPRAVESYDQALKIEPGLSAALKNRGRAEFYLGNFPQSVADLAAGLRFDPTNTFVVVWLHMARMRAGQGDTTALAADLARTDPQRWPAPVAKLYRGTGTVEDVATAAATGDANAQMLQKCGAAFYVGEHLLWAKKTADATARFKEAQAICPKDASEYQAAVAELGRL
jgi:lipoprotein NlpI